MSDISLRGELDRRGLSGNDLSLMVRDGRLVRVRRGAYAEGSAWAAGPELDAVRRHRLLLTAVVRQFSDDFVVSHDSACVLLGLPTWNAQLARAHLTRGRAGGGKRRADVILHGLPLTPDEVIARDGWRVTGLARTVLDVACSSALGKAVAVGDAALRTGLDLEALAAAIETGAGRTGIRRARAAFAFLDPRSESPGESISRVTLVLQGIPVPELQYEVYAADGTLVGRTDMAWPEQRTLGEFDGRGKYGVLRKPGQRPEDVVFAEKLREDRLRALGWEMVRWTWADLDPPAELVRRLHAAFARGQDRVHPTRPALAGRP